MQEKDCIWSFFMEISDGMKLTKLKSSAYSEHLSGVVDRAKME